MLHRNWKLSHIIIWIFLSIVTIQAIVFAYEASNNLTQKDPVRRSVWLIGKGPYFLDTIRGKYQHLVADFPLIELDPNADQLLSVEGYANGKRFLSTEIHDDTLFVRRAQPESDTVVVAIDEDYAALVRVGSQSLKSITLISPGHINIPVNPYGANPGGPIVYKPEDWEKYVLRNKELDLHFVNGAAGDFFLESELVNLYVTNEQFNSGIPGFFTPRIQSVKLIGTSSATKLINPKGQVTINALELVSDSVIIHTSPHLLNPETGTFAINCVNYLNANLLNDMDVIYKGQPRIIKSERNFGRVINGNK